VFQRMDAHGSTLRILTTTAIGGFSSGPDYNLPAHTIGITIGGHCGTRGPAKFICTISYFDSHKPQVGFTV